MVQWAFCYLQPNATVTEKSTCIIKIKKKNCHSKFISQFLVINSMNTPRPLFFSALLTLFPLMPPNASPFFSLSNKLLLIIYSWVEMLYPTKSFWGFSSNKFIIIVPMAFCLFFYDSTFYIILFSTIFLIVSSTELQPTCEKLESQNHVLYFFPPKLTWHSVYNRCIINVFSNK